MCDVSKDDEIARLFATLKERHGKLHALVHSVAYAPADGRETSSTPRAKASASRSTSASIP